MDSGIITQLLAVFGGIACVGGGIAYLVKLWTWLKSPNTKQDEIIKAHGEQLEKHQSMLNHDNDRLNDLEEQDRLVMQALFALLSHGIDGNDIEAMRRVKDQIQKYLIQK